MQLSDTTPAAVLHEVFGYTEFRPGQEKVIDAVLAGRDCIAVMPTGAGKSMTFMVPARIMSGTVLVLSPLISLMKDQIDTLNSLGFSAVAINSTISFEERKARLAALRRGEYELVYIASPDASQTCACFGHFLRAAASVSRAASGRFAFICARASSTTIIG